MDASVSGFRRMRYGYNMTSTRLHCLRPVDKIVVAWTLVRQPEIERAAVCPSVQQRTGSTMSAACYMSERRNFR